MAAPTWSTTSWSSAGAWTPSHGQRSICWKRGCKTLNTEGTLKEPPGRERTWSEYGHIPFADSQWNDQELQLPLSIWKKITILLWFFFTYRNVLRMSLAFPCLRRQVIVTPYSYILLLFLCYVLLGRRLLVLIGYGDNQTSWGNLWHKCRKNKETFQKESHLGKRHSLYSTLQMSSNVHASIIHGFFSAVAFCFQIHGYSNNVCMHSPQFHHLLSYRKKCTWNVFKNILNPLLM